MTGKTNLNNVKELLSIADYENQADEVEENEKCIDIDIIDDDNENLLNDEITYNIKEDDDNNNSVLLNKNKKINS